MVIEYCKLIQICKYLDPMLIVISCCIGHRTSAIVLGCHCFSFILTLFVYAKIASD